MVDQNSQSPLLYHYLKKYQADPTSRVFAPLAEAYRKAGLVDDAIDIAKEGLELHPNFVGGRVALARALFDKHEFGEVVEQLGPILKNVPDNILAQRLLAESNLMLGRVAEALDAYKMVLYFNPTDQETGQIVKELELQAYQKGALVLQKPTEAKPNKNNPTKRPGNQVEALPRAEWIRKIEFLQGLLQNVQNHKSGPDTH